MASKDVILASGMTAKQEKFLKVLTACMGIVSTACAKFKIDRQTHYNWCSANSTYKTAVEAINERNIDFAESKLFTHIQNNDIASLLFFLKCKAKNRGYVEKQVIESENKHTIEMSPDLKLFMDGLQKK